MNESSRVPRVTQIAPQLPPHVNGVGDYCHNLWEHWPQPRPDWRFLVCYSVEKTRQAWAGERVSRFKDTTEGIVSGLEAVETELAVLHYVNYAFNPYGTPLWLPPGLAAWKQRGPRRRLVVMFHELYAGGSIFKRAFWKQPWTRGLVRDLVRLADGWATSCQAHETKLLHQFRADPARGMVAPIGSNIPAVAPVDFQRTPAANRKLNGVVFGLANTRLWALQKHRNLLLGLARQQRLQTVTLLGKKETSPASLAEIAALRETLGPGVIWEEQCDLEAGAISEILARQDFGLICNTPDTLTKSGVAAALALHGVIPVICGRAGRSSEQGVLQNDDSSASISAVHRALAEEGSTRVLRLDLQRLAVEKLSWSGITARWENFLRRPVLGLSSDDSAGLPSEEKRVSPSVLNL